MTARAQVSATAVLAAVRSRRPLVHCLTNTVTAARVADALAAVGALPVMASAEEEVRDFARSADALLLNCGTPSAAGWRAMREAALVARERDVPIVLDPVGCAVSRWRSDGARDLLAVSHAIVRGNAPEVAALAGLAAAGTLRGITAVSVPADEIERVAADAARALATTVLVSGPLDAAAEGARVISAPAVEAVPAVIGLGDVLGALVAACACVQQGRLEATWAAREILTDALRAAARASGPGSFWPAFLDALARPVP